MDASASGDNGNKIDEGLHGEPCEAVKSVLSEHGQQAWQAECERAGHSPARRVHYPDVAIVQSPSSLIVTTATVSLADPPARPARLPSKSTDSPPQHVTVPA